MKEYWYHRIIHCIKLPFNPCLACGNLLSPLCLRLSSNNRISWKVRMYSCFVLSFKIGSFLGLAGQLSWTGEMVWESQKSPQALVPPLLYFFSNLCSVPAAAAAAASFAVRVGVRKWRKVVFLLLLNVDRDRKLYTAAASAFPRSQNTSENKQEEGYFGFMLMWCIMVYRKTLICPETTQMLVWLHLITADLHSY